MKVATKSLTVASVALISFLTLWESGGKTVNTVYADKLAGGLPTVCNGITKHSYTKRPIVVGDHWTDEECHEAEKLVITYTQNKLSKCMPYASQEAFDAITSLSHNVGVERVCKQSRAVRLINAGNIKEGCRAIAFGEDGRHVWSTSDGVYYAGLHNRRVAEMRMCLRGIK
jgi:GH24 family phage-related lysozyme (muramidase)